MRQKNQSSLKSPNVKMFRVTFILSSCYFITAITATSIQKGEPFFRSDYSYVPSQAAFYKIHKTEKIWSEALALCQYEGAALVVPESKSEIDTLRKIIDHNLTNASIAVYTGISDVLVEGTFATTSGFDISEIFENWASDRPTTPPTSDTSDCVVMRRNMKYSDVVCSRKFPFICKKTLSTLTFNLICQTADINYFPDAAGNRCYKLHLKPKIWPDAYAVCRAEQGYLAIVNDAAEVKLLKDKFAEYPNNTIKGNFNKNQVYMGFHDRFIEGEYITVLGRPLSETGYEEWSPGQPDNAKYSEDCGTMFRSGLYNDVNCWVKLMFFCEREVGDSEVGIFVRFQEDTPVIQ